MTTYPYPHPAGNGVTIVGRNHVGLVAVSDDLPGFGYYLTDCHLASAKGGEYGVVCRACHAEVDPALGGVVTMATCYLCGGTVPDLGEIVVQDDHGVRHAFDSCTA